MTSSSRSLTPLLVFILCWGSAVVALSLTGIVAKSPVPPPAFAFLLAGGLLLAARLWPALGDRLKQLPLRALVLYHAVRIVAGSYFLVLYGRGVLPANFALPAGWGDIAVGVSAVLVAWLAVPARSKGQRRVVFGWNVLGLIDIIAVLTNGMRYAIQQPELIGPFTQLPLTLLPLFIVPLVLTSHVLVFRALRTGSRR
ncbi:MAG: hypothetical protein AAGI08_01660 [Bacteroidota bacterium]